MLALNQVPYTMIKMKKEQLLLKNEENKATEQVIWNTGVIDVIGIKVTVFGEEKSTWKPG